MVTLETDRLLLRPFTLEDMSSLDSIFMDPKVMAYSDGIKTKAQIEFWLGEALHRLYPVGLGPLAVVRKEDHNFLGYCGLFLMPDLGEYDELEIGFRLGTAAWGKGFATEAALAIKRYAISTLGANRLICLIDPGNLGSIRVAEKLGMSFEKEAWLPGYTHPDHIYALKNLEEPLGM